MLRELGIPHGVIVNRSDPEYDHFARDFCREKGVRILAEIPDDRRVAVAYSRGELAYDALPEYRDRFRELLVLVEKEAVR